MSIPKPPKKEKKRRNPTDVRLTLTREIIDQACELARKGNFRQTIYKRLGISRGTWDAWLTRGRADIRDREAGKIKELGLKACLVLELDKAESEVCTQIHEDIMTSDDPALKFKFLRVRYPKMYSGISTTFVDDESGSEEKTPGVDLLAQKLASFLGD